MGEEGDLGGHIGQDPGPSLGTLDRTWGLLVFYSFLFAKVGAQACLLTPLLCSVCSSISSLGMKQLNPLARSTGTGSIC